jgi:predicted dehydrogenase
VKRLTFAIVGCGHIGQRHINVISEEPKATLTDICDIDEDKARSLAKNLDDVRVHTDYAQMLEKTKADVICICTPHALHSSMSIQAARAGKHILVEKPMALTTKQSQKMIDVAQKEGVRLFVVKQNRYNKPIALAKKALFENKLGKIFMVQCNVMWNRHAGYYEESDWKGKKELEGGALHTQVSHFIDLLVWWFGDLKEAKSITGTLHQKIEIEDCGVSALRFESGAIGSLLWTTCVYNVNYEGSITIIGENGTIKIGGKYLNEIDFWDVKSYPLPKDIEMDDKPNNYGSYQGSSSNHDKLFNDLITKITAGREGMVEGPEGMKTIEAIEMIYDGSE